MMHSPVHIKGIVLPEHYKVCLAGAVCLPSATVHIVLELS